LRRDSAAGRDADVGRDANPSTLDADEPGFAHFAGMSNARYPTLVLSSRNQKKSREIREILAPVGVELQSVADFPEMGEIDETGDTFLANATLKAVGPAKALRRWTIGEDSGLIVDALGGQPGVYSARFSGPDATDASNNAKLLAELADTPDELRTAAYVCTIVLADPDGNVRLTSVGRCTGRISRDPRGENGFGYDPYFLVPEYGLTFGQLSTEIKHRISHRANAFADFVPKLQALFRNEFGG
jgi:XTP/dITP diphosphohydrolase